MSEKVADRERIRAFLESIGFVQITDESDRYESWKIRNREVEFWVNFDARHETNYGYNVVDGQFSFSEFFVKYMDAVDEHIEDIIMDIDNQWANNYQ